MGREGVWPKGMKATLCDTLNEAAVSSEEPICSNDAAAGCWSCSHSVILAEVRVPHGGNLWRVIQE